MLVYSYIRVSGKSQVDGDGPDRQREAIRTFCSERKLELVTEFFEKAVSGTVEGIDRPAFSDLLDCASEYPLKIDALVVERIDRLARDLMVSELLLAECRKRGIKVFSVDQGNTEDMASNGGDPTRVLIRQIMGALAQWEKSVIVKKLRLSRERIRARGERCEGKIAYGCLNITEKTILQTVGNLRKLACVPSSRNIARMLNDSGFRNRAGHLWTFQNVSKLIKTKGL